MEVIFLHFMYASGAYMFIGLGRRPAGMLLQEAVTRSANRQPHAIAIVSDGEIVSYAQLDDLSNRMARLLVAAGCEPGDRIGLLLPTSIPAIVGMLAALKARAIYVPLDIASPPARVAKIIDACRPEFILTANSASKLLNAVSDCIGRGAYQVGWLDAVEPADALLDLTFSWADLACVAPAPVPSLGRPEDPAHIVFMSGSTGVPKGVVITHDNVSCLLDWATKYFGIAPSDKISCHAPLHFDVSAFNVFGTFVAGAALHLVPPDASLLPQYLAEYIRRHELTQWFSAPSALMDMAQFNVLQYGDFPNLRRVLWCGEALPVRTLIYWMRHLPHSTFTNLYGKTETTIASGYYTVPHCPENEATEIPIGRACEGQEMLVLDESLEPAPSGEIGELYIRGVGLSPGYWRDPEKTVSVFIMDRQGQRAYKTGDLAKVGEDGLVYLARPGRFAGQALASDQPLLRP
jgi:amino acid adenylation domain-containing protein